MSVVIPMVLIEWSNDDWVSECISESGLSLLSIIEKDVNAPLTSTGSTLLHLATMCAHLPSVSVANKTIETLLSLGANPNARDHYGRTPFTNLITKSPYVLHHHKAEGIEMVNSLFERNADPNVMFTPDFLGYSGCEKWTLAHDLQDEHHGKRKWDIPNEILTLLNAKLDFFKLNSSGKEPILKELPLTDPR